MIKISCSLGFVPVFINIIFAPSLFSIVLLDLREQRECVIGDVLS